jgi:hypothetical protein
MPIVSPSGGAPVPGARRVRILPLMSSNLLVFVACAAVAVVLVFGLANMMRGGNANLSQKLMRLRVLLQFVAILIIMGVVWWRSA